MSRQQNSSRLHGQASRLSVTAAQKRRDLGIQIAANHAEQARQRWRSESFDGFALFLSKQEGDFLSETFVEWSRGRLAQPPDGRAWGGVIKRAANLGLIKRIGTGLATTSNLSPKTLWRKAA